MAVDYTGTLNLPETEFPMRANLAQREPEIRKYWEENDLYGRLLAHNAKNKRFMLHDGPPFSNGNIHIGTAMNKILKDFIVKSKTMEGYLAPYIPGWDNHGMPIESAIIKRNKLNRKNMSVSDFRTACREFANEFVQLQKESFRRLGVIGDWDNAYLTMSPDFEATEVKVFGEMFKKGYIYKGLKPVYWCAHDETALAEAEIEYCDDECTSVFVKFPVSDDKGLLNGICELDHAYFVIWTTTIWTLPGNVAIALHPRENYVLVKAGEEYYIVMEALAEATMKAGGIEEWETVTVFKGAQFEYAKAKHPFLDRESLVVNAEYVTAESGTGCVHTAPGFGADDYVTGQRYKLDILVPVDDRGRQTELAGKYAGLTTEESNEAILADLKTSGLLFASERISHQYPHCWRCKKPIIFRATPQWFVSVEAYKDAAAKACDDVEWIPEWGHDRMVSMVRERADWCISRQRHWGLPIPVFTCADCGKVICDDDTIGRISELFARHGSNVWFEREAAELLPEGYVCPECGSRRFVKETDTLDGWFDSGSTHFYVLNGSEGREWPADLYLEGADQYRGWFQSSLLTAVGTRGGGAPYRQVLTHGWVVDGEGKAMHKSLGNSVAPEEIITKYGADMLRLWVAASDYHVDVRASDAIFKQLSESYRKIRNTLRILLANLGDNDFDPSKDMVPAEQMQDLDKWLLSGLNALAARVKAAYDSYTFHDVYHDIHNFCSIDLSKLYIDICKDRLYTQSRDSVERRSAQTAIYHTLSAITRMLAPVLSYTCEETWRYMRHEPGEEALSVFLNPLPDYRADFDFPEQKEHFDRLFEVRDDVCKALELERAQKRIGKSLEASLTIYGTRDNEAMQLFEKDRDILETVFIVSEVKLSYDEPAEPVHDDTASGIKVAVHEAPGEKCVRCWMHSTETTADEDGQALCPRCRKVLGK